MRYIDRINQRVEVLDDAGSDGVSYGAIEDNFVSAAIASNIQGCCTAIVRQPRSKRQLIRSNAAVVDQLSSPCDVISRVERV